MRLVARFLQRRGLAVIAILGTLSLLPIWLSLPKLYPLSESIDSNHPPIYYNSRLLPIRYWVHRLMYAERYIEDISCLKFPFVNELEYVARSWQVVRVDKGHVYVFGAYYDNRFKEPLVRVLIYTDVTLPKLLCQFWFLDDNEPQTEVAEPNTWSPEWWPFDGVSQTFVLTCRGKRRLPAGNSPPTAVTVTSDPCGVATNLLKVQGVPVNDPMFLEDEKPPRRDGTSVAVCLKLLGYQTDVSVQVIEWLQLLKHFGAKKVFVYIDLVHPNTRKVLQHYEDQGFVMITELLRPLLVPRQNKTASAFLDYKMELIQLNDCLYRSIGEYDWIASLYLDEILVPPPGTTWVELIDNETVNALAKPEVTPIDALVFPSYYILDEAQKDLVAPANTRILAHAWRSKTPNPPGLTDNPFFNVSSVTTLHNHGPLSCNELLRSCRRRHLPDGKMLRYREKCPLDREDCKKLHDVVREDILDVWRELVLAEVRAVLDKLALDRLE